MSNKDPCFCGHTFSKHDETWKCTVDKCNCCLFKHRFNNLAEELYESVAQGGSYAAKFGHSDIMRALIKTHNNAIDAASDKCGTSLADRDDILELKIPDL